MIDFEICSKELVSQAFLIRKITCFSEACAYIAHLPYQRNQSKDDILCVLTDGWGTCSTKHAVLHKLAFENGISTVQLLLGIFKMDGSSHPAVAETLANANLSYLLEAHIYLKIGSLYVDFTKPDAHYEQFADRIILERPIAYHQVNRYKIQFHRHFLQGWLQENRLPYDLDALWAIRETCIQDLSKPN